MKTLVKVLISALFLLSFQGVAQKIGHVDFDSIVRLLPNYDSVRAVSEKFGKSLDKEYQDMYAELDKKIKEYKDNEKIWTEFMLGMKKKDIEALQQNIQEFPQNAQNEMAKKNAELLGPLEKKAKSLIELVAKEGKYTYVMDSGAGILIISPPGDDLLPMVKAKIKK